MQDIDDNISNYYSSLRSRRTIPDILDEEGGILIKGNLGYQAGTSGNWKKRYVILQGHSLVIYAGKTQFDNDDEPIRTINTLLCSAALWPVSDRANCFELTTPSKVIYFHAANHTERMEWINLIRKPVRVYFSQNENEDIQSTNTEKEIVQHSLQVTTITPKARRTPVVKSRGRKARNSIPVELTTEFFKTSVLFRQTDKGIDKERIELKNRYLLVYKKDKVKLEVDLLLAHEIDEESIYSRGKRVEKKMVKIHFFDLTTPQSVEKLGSTHIEETQEWIKILNQCMLFMRDKQKSNIK